MEERSRRPWTSPGQTSSEIEARIVAWRRQRPDWGARKLAVLLEREGKKLPVITVHRVLLRHGLVLPHDRRRTTTQRFERERPNELWQMDFKGPKECKAAVGPLSVLDDHSRYLVALEQTGSTRGQAVRERLEAIFSASGVPEAMLMDHGVPWWNAQAPSGWTRLLVWLMKQGIGCHFSGYRHPQIGVPADRSWSVGWRPRARWSDFMARWNEHAAAAPASSHGWRRVGSMSSATSTTRFDRIRPSPCERRLRSGSRARAGTIPTRPSGSMNREPRSGESAWTETSTSMAGVGRSVSPWPRSRSSSSASTSASWSITAAL